MFTYVKQTLSIGLLVILVSGCFKTIYVWKSEPSKRSVDNEFFIAEISPEACDVLGCAAFRLSIKNKTNMSLEVNWNKTLYIFQNQTFGNFMFKEVSYKERDNPRPPDVISPGGELLKSIWPNNLIGFFGGKYNGWGHKPMPSGENGIYLTVVVEGREINEILTVVLSRTQIEPQEQEK